MALPIITSATLAQAIQNIDIASRELLNDGRDADRVLQVCQYVVHRMANPHLHAAPFSPVQIASFADLTSGSALTYIATQYNVRNWI